MTRNAQKSVVGATLDLMEHFGRGNYDLFRRCFEKVLRYFDAAAVDLGERRLATYAFHHLRAFGHIDIAEEETGTPWCVAPPVLVEVSPRTFVAIGTNGDMQRLEAVSSAGALRHKSPTPVRRGNVSLPFFPQAPILEASLKSAESAAELAKFSISRNYQQQLYASLPSLPLAIKQLCEPVSANPEFDAGTLSIFDTRSMSWQEAKSGVSAAPGLYERHEKFGQNQLFLNMPGEASQTTLSRLRNRSWSLVVALAATGNRLALEYDPNKQELAVPTSKLGYPVVLERAFRSGTLRRPTFVDATRGVFERISADSVCTLIEKLPVFEVKVQ